MSFTTKSEVCLHASTARKTRTPHVLLDKTTTLPTTVQLHNLNALCRTIGDTVRLQWVGHISEDAPDSWRERHPWS